MLCVELYNDKLLVRNRPPQPKSTDPALLIDKTAIPATGLVLNLEKAAIVDKTAIGWTAIGFDKQQLRLAGLDKVAILQALDKNGSAWPLINSLHGTI